MPRRTLFAAGRIPPTRHDEPEVEPTAFYLLRCGRCNRMYNRCVCPVDGDRIRDDNFDRGIVS